MIPVATSKPKDIHFKIIKLAKQQLEESLTICFLPIETSFSWFLVAALNMTKYITKPEEVFPDI